MEVKDIKVSSYNHKRLSDICHKNESYNDVISKMLDFYEKYHEIIDLIDADKEFENRKGISFSSLDELDEYLNI